MGKGTIVHHGDFDLIEIKWIIEKNEDKDGYHSINMKSYYLYDVVFDTSIYSKESRTFVNFLINSFKVSLCKRQTELTFESENGTMNFQAFQVGGTYCVMNWNS